jgi:hypothetical protein
LSIFSISLGIYILEKVDVGLRGAGRFVLAVIGVKGRITCEWEEAERAFSACYVLVCIKTYVDTNCRKWSKLATAKVEKAPAKAYSPSLNCKVQNLFFLSEAGAGTILLLVVVGIAHSLIGTVLDGAAIVNSELKEFNNKVLRACLDIVFITKALTSLIII